MTFSSLRVALFDANVAANELEAAGTKSTPLANLDHFARDRCAPHELANWATSRGMPVFYVDNEWVRVPVDGEVLKEFASDIVKQPGALDAIAERHSADSGRLVISAEEF